MNILHWTPELAYIVGLMVTDGNLSKDKRHMSMRSSDLDLLNTFKICLNLKNKISQTKNDGYAKRPCYRIQFGNVRLYRWLEQIGLFPNKTYTMGEIKIPDNYFRDFLRGHLDGDGTILTYQDRYNIYRGRTYINQRIYVKFISASQLHINWLYKEINELAGVKGSLTNIWKQNKNRVPIWTIKFSKKESIKLLSWLYYHPYLPSLQRKKYLAQNILQNYTNEQRRIYTRIGI